MCPPPDFWPLLHACNDLTKILSILQVIDTIIIQNLFNFRLISLKKFFVVEFLCDFDMERYPFDSQNCFAEIEIANGGEFIELITGNSFSDQLKILP